MKLEAKTRLLVTAGTGVLLNRRQLSEHPEALKLAKRAEKEYESGHSRKESEAKETALVSKEAVKLGFLHKDFTPKDLKTFMGDLAYVMDQPVKTKRTPLSQGSETR
jgi:hypothetical protein